MKALIRSRLASGFTLVEMLIVISIVALLAGLLMPVIGNMKEKGRRAVCANNIKQIHTLIETYMKDYDDVFPFYDVGGSGGATKNAPTVIDENVNILIRRDYTRNLKIFQCPSRSAAGSKLQTGGNQKKAKYDYEYNGNLSFAKSSSDGGKPPRAYKGTQVLEPSLIRLVWDNDDEGGDDGGSGGQGGSGDGFYDSADNHGADGGWVCYVDGHLKWWNGVSYKGTEEVDPDPRQ